MSLNFYWNKTDCKHSPDRKPCFVREPSADTCQACLKALAEHEELTNQNVCCRCGASDTYSEFKETGHAHICSDLTPQSAGKK